VIDASPAAITLAMLRTDEELDSLEKGGWRWRKSRGADDQVEPMSQALNRVGAPQPSGRHGEPAQCLAPDGRPRMDGVTGR
jgi:hypothetical protein